MDTVRVTFLPDECSIEVLPGTSLLDAADRAGIMLRSSCGGDGTCGRCKVRVVEGEVDATKKDDAGLVLSCRSLAVGDCVVEIPADTRVQAAQVLTDRSDHVLRETDLGLGEYEFQPLARRWTVSVSEPTLTENASDLTRVRAALRRQCGCDQIEFDQVAIRQLPTALRSGQWTITAGVIDYGDRLRVVQIIPGADDTPVYGLAVDVGTTTVATVLIDLATGHTVDRRGEYNRQSRYGDDVITRIIHSTDSETGIGDLQWAVIDTINHLIEEACLAAGVKRDHILCAMIAGNTTMMHLLTGVSAQYLRLEPYIPAAVDLPETTGSDLGLAINPKASVFFMPSVASYVGGDIVSGALVTGVGSRSDAEVLIDIGTNGEVLLGNNDWLVSCACSAGPCFEGSGVYSGMRAEPGAIQRVRIGDDNSVELVTIGGGHPRGICGSGLIDTIAHMVERGLIDRSGRFAGDDKLYRPGPEGDEFVLAEGINGGRDVVIREGDVNNVLRAKAAIYAGICSLLSSVQLEFDHVKRLFIAGGFGSYLVLDDAIKIGLLPDLPGDKYEFAGNTSVKGARLALLSRQAWNSVHDIASRITCIELSTGTTFMDEFTSALFLPHTDLTQFPSVKFDREERP